ncbi:MAG TPA: kelch repeat-containing protein, partial [Acidimicrobiales bacterium]|nr:kelch repeat-containing protein [Acidimicrobiales bacterium]
MSTAHHQTWDQALVRRLRAGDHRRRVSGLFAALLVVGLVVGLLPGVAEAHYGDPGINGAQLDVETTDSADSGLFPAPQPVNVKGIGFVPNAVAEIFQCAEGANDLREECVRVGAALTDASGAFNTASTATNPNKAFVSTIFKDSTCKAIGPTQCIVAAATYDPVSSQPTSQAQHGICFYANAPFTQVAPCYQHSGTTTTTAAPPLEPEWQFAPSMATARQYLSTATGADGRIYALGGSNDEGDALGSAETFDSCKQTWSSLPPMPVPRTEFAAARGPNGRIYVIGGRDARFGTPLATVDAYDPVANTWSSVASLALPRGDLAAATGADGRIYAIGGVVGPQPGFTVSNVEAYDTVTNSWSPAAPLSYPRSHHGAVSGPDGRLYVFGGLGPLGGIPLTTRESYSPGPAGTGVWQPVNSGPGQPADLGAAAGPDGLIYAIGGSQVDEGLRTVSVYDTATGAWAPRSEPLTTPRAALGAARGRDGRIYAIGGSLNPFDDNGPGPLATTESLQVGPNTCPSLPPVADFNGDRSTDIAVFRPANGVSYLRGQTPEAVAWGAEGDIPVPGDYDGDKQSDLAVFRPSNGVWYLRGQTPDAVAYGTDG